MIKILACKKPWPQYRQLNSGSQIWLKKKKKTFTEGEQIIAGLGSLNMLQLFRVVEDKKIQEK